MQRAPMALAVFLGLGATAVPPHPDPGFVLESKSVELPPGDRTFPPGPGSDAANGYCLACHSAGMVLTQPPKSRSDWTALVGRMRQNFKAPVPDDQVGAIVDYLTRIKGRPEDIAHRAARP